jgi:hypothetical protein
MRSILLIRHMQSEDLIEYCKRPQLATNIHVTFSYHVFCRQKQICSSMNELFNIRQTATRDIHFKKAFKEVFFSEDNLI